MRSSSPVVLMFALAATACDAPLATLPDASALPPPAEAARHRGPNIVDATNDALEAQDSPYRVAYAEYYTDAASGISGNVIYARDLGNKRADLQFIPDDPRRGGFDGDPNTIDFWIDQTQGATGNGLGEGATTAAIARGMQTWDAERCSDLGANIVAVPVDLGLIQWAAGFGGGGVASDVMHAGWLPGAFFDLVQPEGATYILGITFTLVFTEGDLDGNGEPDLGAREIYYNDAFPWADDGVSGVDVESVALHEAGHGLSQEHFGTIFEEPHSGTLHFSPLAVMNAAYSGPRRSLRGTDRAGHCGIWGSWPNE